MSATPAARSEFAEGWPVVLSAMLGIGLGLSPVPFYTIGPLAPELARSFHWGFGDIQLGLFVMTAAVLVASPLAGLVADRVGVRPVALVSCLMFGLSFMGFALSDGSLILFYTTWAAVAVCGAGTLPITWTRAVNHAFERHKGLALGLSLAGTGIFGFLIKPLIAFLLAHVGWRGTYVAIGALPILVALPVALWGFHDASWTRSGRAGVAPAPAAPGLSFGEAVRTWRFWLIAAALVPVSFAVGGPIPNIENILKTRGFEHADSVSLAALIGFAVIAGRLVGGWLMDRIWAPLVGCLMLMSAAVSCWLMSRSGISWSEAALALWLLGMAAGVEYDLAAFLVARYFGLRSYVAIYGSMYSAFAIGAGTGPYVFGRWFDGHGSYDGMLAGSGLALALAATSFLALGRYRDFGPAQPASITSTSVPSGASIVPDSLPP